MKKPTTIARSLVASADRAAGMKRGGGARRPYEAPRVTAHGPLVRIALGGTPGVGDSGAQFTQKPPA